MRIVYAGTSEFACTVLAAMVDAGLIPVAVYTRADQPAGRGLSVRPGPVKTLAVQRLGESCEIVQPTGFSDPQTVAQLASYRPDVIVTAAYGLLLPQSVLDLARVVAVNVHPSLLPRWRGAAPITYALGAGDHNTGVSLAKMERALDTGAVFAQREMEILPADTGGTLSERLADMATKMTVDFLQEIKCRSVPSRASSLAGVAQDNDKATYAPKLTKQQMCIDWSTDAQNIEAWIRALQPRPRAHTFINGDKLIIHQAHIDECRPNEQALGHGAICPGTDALRIRCADKVICPDRVQLPGKRQMSTADFLRGYPIENWAGLSFSRSALDTPTSPSS